MSTQKKKTITTTTTSSIEVSKELQDQLSSLGCKQTWQVKTVSHPSPPPPEIKKTNNTSTVQPLLYLQIQEWIEERHHCNENTSLCLGLFGPTGSGKTHLLQQLSHKYQADLVMMDSSMNIEMLLTTQSKKERWILFKHVDSMDLFPLKWIQTFSQLMTKKFCNKFSIPLLFMTGHDVYSSNQLKRYLVQPNLMKLIPVKPVSNAICTKLLKQWKSSAPVNIVNDAKGDLHQLKVLDQWQGCKTSAALHYSNPFEITTSLFNNKKGMSAVPHLLSTAKDIDFIYHMIYSNWPIYFGSVDKKNNNKLVMEACVDVSESLSDMDYITTTRGFGESLTYHKDDESSEVMEMLDIQQLSIAWMIPLVYNKVKFSSTPAPVLQFPKSNNRMMQTNKQKWNEFYKQLVQNDPEITFLKRDLLDYSARRFSLGSSETLSSSSLGKKRKKEVKSTITTREKINMEWILHHAPQFISVSKKKMNQI